MSKTKETTFSGTATLYGNVDVTIVIIDPNWTIEQAKELFIKDGHHLDLTMEDDYCELTDENDHVIAEYKVTHDVGDTEGFYWYDDETEGAK